MKAFSKYLVFSSFLAFVACTKDVGRFSKGDYPDDVGEIITRSCAVSGCHNGLSYQAAGNYNLSTWTDMFKGSNTGSPVIPYNSKFSSLCYYINTYADLGLQNKPTMPLNRQPLSREQVQLIKTWIDEGAPDRNGKVMWADNPGLKKLYAVNQGCDVVTVFDSETQLPIRYIQVGTKDGMDTPHHLRVSPDGKYWYVIFINNNVMQKYRCSDDAFVGNIPLTPYAAGTSASPEDDAADWNTFVISPDSRFAYCISWTQNGKVSAVDLEKMKLLHYTGGLHYSHGVALNAAADKLYITAQTGNFITELDTGFTGDQLLSLSNGINYSSSLDPHDIILSPDGQNFLITCQGSNEVRVFNIAGKTVSHIIPTGVYPQEIAYSKSTDEYFVTCTSDTVSVAGARGVVTRIKAGGYSASNIKCGYQPHGLAVDESKKLLYVLSRNISASGPLPHHSSTCAGRNGFLNFVDLNNFKVLDRKIELSVDPYFIFARP